MGPAGGSRRRAAGFDAGQAGFSAEQAGLSAEEAGFALNDTACIAGLRRRNAEWLGRWPRHLALAAAVPRATRALRPRSRSPSETLPFWLVLPSGLAEAYRKRGAGSAPRSFLADVLWGQYCLFQCVRLKDEVFDGHTTDLRLVYVSDQFLIEAERTFAKHFTRSSPFWRVFRDAFESTTRAILQVDELQKRVGHDPARLAREYARVGAIFKVGAVAVSLEHRRGRDVTLLTRITDEVAMADQILDDLEDVDDDLRRGRFNYVAQRICGGGAKPGPCDPEQARRDIARALAVGNSAETITGDADRHLDRAAAAAHALGIPAVSDRLAAARRSVDALRTAFHRAQVKLVLAPIFAAGAH